MSWYVRWESMRNSAGDADASIAMYTEDVEHDVVGAPHGPLQGRDAARDFYEHLNREVDTESMTAYPHAARVGVRRRPHQPREPLARRRLRRGQLSAP